MKMKRLLLSVAFCAAAISTPAMSQGLSDDARDACAAILCLSSGKRPDECTPPIRRYFSISYRKLSDTLRGRADFLSLCPAAKSDSKMGSLTDAIVNGAGRCDASSLNANQVVMGGRSGNGETYQISNTLPSACTTLVSHAYTDLKNTLPVYVGLPERQGFWVTPAEYAQAVQGYNVRIAAEDAAARQAAVGGGN